MRTLSFSQERSANLTRVGENDWWAVVNIPARTKAAIDYQTCRYDGSPMVFRGPLRSLKGDYVAVIGGSETFGKFVPRPFTDLVEARLNLPVVNLGVMQAGPQFFLEDRGVTDIASGARLTVLQIMGAQNMSNRFYSVHPRRNDRFLTGSEGLQALFPDVDFTEFNFTGHLVSALEDRDQTAFASLVSELKVAWVERMRHLVSLIDGECLLLWMSEHGTDVPRGSSHAPDPLFVDHDMLLDLRGHVAGLVEVTASPRARRERLQSRFFLPGEEAAARALPGPRFHCEVARALTDALEKRLGSTRDARRVNTPERRCNRG